MQLKCLNLAKFVDTLKPNELVIVKAMKNPPAGVKLVMEAVCVMLEKTPERKIDPATQKPVLDYWPTSVRLLADMDFRKVNKIAEIVFCFFSKN